MSNTSLSIRKLVPVVLLACAISQGAERDSAAGDRLPADVQTWLKQLQSHEPDVRQTATSQLMGLTPDQLLQIRTYFSTAPCHPAQAAALQRVVTYVITRAKLGNETSTTTSFLGLHFLDDEVETFDVGERHSPGVGVQPIPGFVAQRFIEDGDIVIGLGQGKAFKRTQSFRQFRPILDTYGPGEPITVQVMRGQSLLTFTFALDAAPSDMESPPMMFDRIERAEAEAEAYWTTEFAPTLERSR